VANVNLRCNRLLQAGQHPEVRDPQAVLDEFGRYRSWDEVMTENGPYDEPTFCFAQGVQLANSSLFRQAVHQLERVKAMTPAFMPARVWLANIFLVRKQPAEALKIMQEIRANPQMFPVNRTNAPQIVYLEASALLANTNDAKAVKLVDDTLEKYPKDDEILGTCVQIYMNNERYTNALPLIEQQLALNPTNLNLLLNKGFANLQAHRYDEAIPALTHLLTLETNASDIHNTALLNRAIAYLKAGKLGESRQDYETLQKSFPTSFRIYYGLGEIAYQRKDTNAAVRNYHLYLTNAPNNPDEINAVIARLKELRPGYPN
jgi:tetratricopeptide (TPR) repeat protein